MVVVLCARVSLNACVLLLDKNLHNQQHQHQHQGSSETSPHRGHGIYRVLHGAASQCTVRVTLRYFRVLCCCALPVLQPSQLSCWFVKYPRAACVPGTCSAGKGDVPRKAWGCQQVCRVKHVLPRSNRVHWQPCCRGYLLL